MVKKSDPVETTQAAADTSTTTRVEKDAGQADAPKDVRRGLGAPPPGTQGDPSIKAG